jgi:hypothetical protein
MVIFPRFLVFIEPVVSKSHTFVTSVEVLAESLQAAQFAPPEHLAAIEGTVAAKRRG